MPDRSIMRVRRRLAVLLVPVACSSATGVEQLTLADLVGTWDATAIEVTNNLDPSLQEDLYALGVRWQITVTGAGTFTVELANPFGTDSYSGTISIEGDSLVMESTETASARWTLHYVFDGGAIDLTWVGTEQCGSYDWTAPECPIPVTFRMTLRKR